MRFAAKMCLFSITYWGEFPRIYPVNSNGGAFTKGTDLAALMSGGSFRMKQKSENTKKTYAGSKEEIRIVPPAQMKTPPGRMKKIDEAYLHINQTSFQQNFKFLIGHYKGSGQESRDR